jgi:hypothetical protein
MPTFVLQERSARMADERKLYTLATTTTTCRKLNEEKIDTMMSFPANPAAVCDTFTTKPKAERLLQVPYLLCVCLLYLY